VNEDSPTTSKTLRKLYLTLFLRGRSSRGLNKNKAPTSIARKLWGTLALYCLVGLAALTFMGQPSFALSFYLHGMSLLFLGMFVAASAGEILFNKDEPEILLHRPVDARTLLWAKVSVLVRVSLWVACTFNLTGMIIGTVKWSPLFAPVHLVSTGLAALFCSGSVVLMYQLCLRWFGRERLDNLMTTAQVLLAVALVAGSQMAPYLLRGMEKQSDLLAGKWWLLLLPPAWFASFDEVLIGRGTAMNWGLAGLGIAVTAGVLMLAFGKMAGTYEEGLKTLAESRPRVPGSNGGQRWLDRVTTLPILSWMLRDPVTRASFRLSAAYMLRDRDMKLRLYPGLAPMLAMPAIFLLQGSSRSTGEFGIAIAGGYVGLVPLTAMGLLQFSQHWQAADLYRLAPVPGPGRFILGAVVAVLAVLVVPALSLLGVVMTFLPGGLKHLPLLLPGLIALPVYALAPGAIDKTVPLSKPTEESKSAMRGAWMFLMMMSAMILPGIGLATKHFDGFGIFLAVEAVASAVGSFILVRVISGKQWDPIE
jgi:ABC-2 type transport system permease protein